MSYLQQLSGSLALHEFDGGDWPLAIVTSDANSQAVEFIKPNPVYCPGLSISQDDSFANELSLGLVERGKDGGRSGFGGRHGVSRNKLDSSGSHMKAGN